MLEFCFLLLFLTLPPPRFLPLKRSRALHHSSNQSLSVMTVDCHRFHTSFHREVQPAHLFTCQNRINSI